MFAEVLHIPPWRIGDLTLIQFEQAIDRFDDLIKKAKEADRG